MALIDFTLSNARRFYSSMGNPLGLKGLRQQLTLTQSLTAGALVVQLARHARIAPSTQKTMYRLCSSQVDNQTQFHATLA